jgi:quercetin dioxygenase-like cupin family protein
MNTTAGAHFFLLDEVEWPDESLVPAAPRELVEKAKEFGARRKYLARGEGGFFTQYSEFSAGFAVPMHSHDHNEVIVCLRGSLTMLGGDGPTLREGDSMVLIGGHEYGFTAGPEGMAMATIRTGKAETTLTA